MIENPGLAPYDITNYKGARGENFFTTDTVMKDLADYFLMDAGKDHKKDVLQNLENFGSLVGNRLDELIDACHKEGKYGVLKKYDKTGKRIDEIVYSPEQNEARKLAYEFGVLNLDEHPEWKHPFAFFHKMMLAYVLNLNGEGGIACPLAMTDGMILVLREIGTERQKKKYLPIVSGYGSQSHFMAGQYVTERVGGSNVGANRTIAKKTGNGKWSLTGEKWFCSNPGDLWVTTAKVEGTNTIGLFLVHRLRENGELNGHHILRTKDIIGSRGKVTTEIIYEDLEAEELGRTAHGIANLIRYVIKTSRIHVSIGSLAGSRRAYMEAENYTRWRTAYGKKINGFSAISKTLAEIKILITAMQIAVFRNMEFVDQINKCEELLTPLLKYITSSQSSYITKECILIVGGNGIIGDFSILPRLHNDAIINETWEGTHHVVTDHALHAFYRPKVGLAFQSLLDENLSSPIPGIETAINFIQSQNEILKKYLEKDEFWIEQNRLPICELIYGIFSLSELIRMVKEAKEAKKIEFYRLAVLGYREILERKPGGFNLEGSIFENPSFHETIINY